MLKRVLFDKENDIRTSVKIITVSIIAISLYFIFYSLLISIGIKMNGIASAINLTASIYLSLLVFIKLIEKKKLLDIKITHRKKDILYVIIGMIIAFIFHIIILLVMMIITNQVFTIPGVSIHIVFQYLLLAIAEEMLFRGFLLNHTFTTLSFDMRSFIIAVIFMLTHFVTGQGIIASFILPFIFAIFANYLTKYSGSIWMSTGFHFVWNLCIFVFYSSSIHLNLIMNILPFALVILGIPLLYFLRQQTQEVINIKI